MSTHTTGRASSGGISFPSDVVKRPRRCAQTRAAAGGDNSTRSNAVAETERSEVLVCRLYGSRRKPANSRLDVFDMPVFTMDLNCPLAPPAQALFCVLTVLLVLAHNLVEQIRVKPDHLIQRDGPRFGVRLLIVDRDLDLELSEVQPPETLRNLCTLS